MARLEYRLYKEWATEFPLLYYYSDMSEGELLLRFGCDYFVKEGKVYEKSSTSIEDHAYVIYVTESYDEYVVDAKRKPIRAEGEGFGIELREYQLFEDIHPILYTFQYPDAVSAALCLQASYISWEGVEWERSSTEVDEDRRTYVYYAQRAKDY